MMGRKTACVHFSLFPDAAIYRKVSRLCKRNARGGRRVVTLRLFDSFERAKREFAPLDPARVRVYVCGPTVYGAPHIGNARPAVVFDVLARLLRRLFPGVIYARNITDVDDKILDAAAREGVSPEAIAERYGRVYHEDMAALGVAKPDIEPKVTGNMEAIVSMIARLVERGFAYEAEGHVLFHVPAWDGYGALSRRGRDAMLAGARVEVAPYKRDAADFVLWKPSAPEQMGWDSVWGRGRPGWHIECSAMIARHLGESIDIHGGGADLLFPHHENERAQSVCAHGGAALARFWMHNGFVVMGEGKMSKSEGNILTVRDLLEAGHGGEVIRYALLSAHYRKPLVWSDALLRMARFNLDKLYDALEKGGGVGEGVPDAAFMAALEDDLNVPLALRELSRLAQEARGGSPERGAALRASAEMLGLLGGAPRVEGGLSDDAVEVLLRERAAARARGDFASADAVRAELAEQGIIVEDGVEGSSWRWARG